MTLAAGYDIVAFEPVMPGPVPGIHVFVSADEEDVDGRSKSGHDEKG
jgi:hypothetical protein